MTRHLIVVHNDNDRAKAAKWANNAPSGYRIEFKAPKRTHDQNSLLWALLTEVSTQLVWHGMKLSPDDWKLIFLDGLKREVRLVLNIDGNGMVSLGRSSSDLSKQEFSDLIELIRAFGAQHDVQFSDAGVASSARQVGGDSSQSSTCRKETA